MIASLPAVTHSARAERDCLLRLGALANRMLGIRMPATKLPMLRSRLRRRLNQLRIDSFEAYERHLMHGQDAGDELRQFLDIITTNKTDFFREPHHFAFLAERVLPTLARDTPSGSRGTPRFWSAACASGEEVYSLAMVLSEHARATAGFDFSILATDVSTRALDVARSAIYPHALVDPIPEPLRKRYLLRSRDRHNDRVRVRPALRAKARFERLNLMDDHYPIATGFDVVFLRNVLIYFERPVQQRVVRGVCRHLRPGGFLFIGHAESLTGMNLPLEPLGGSVFRVRP